MSSGRWESLSPGLERAGDIRHGHKVAEKGGQTTLKLVKFARVPSIACATVTKCCESTKLYSFIKNYSRV